MTAVRTPDMICNIQCIPIRLRLSERTLEIMSTKQISRVRGSLQSVQFRIHFCNPVSGAPTEGIYWQEPSGTSEFFGNYYPRTAQLFGNCPEVELDMLFAGGSEGIAYYCRDDLGVLLFKCLEFGSLRCNGDFTKHGMIYLVYIAHSFLFLSMGTSSHY